MNAADWERQFEDFVARERALMVDLLDASRGLTGVFRPAGQSTVDAARYFAEKYAAWREVADAIASLAETRLAKR